MRRPRRRTRCGISASRPSTCRTAPCGWRWSGNPGTGKSTVARALAEQVGAHVISTDDVRRELLESGVISGDPGVLDSGLYSPDNVATVYEIVLRRARVCLDHGRSVILDGTWRHPHWRAEARRIAAETHSQPVEIRCAAGIEMTADRIVTRRRATPTRLPRSPRRWRLGRAGGTRRSELTLPSRSLRRRHRRSRCGAKQSDVPMRSGAVDQPGARGAPGPHGLVTRCPRRGKPRAASLRHRRW